MEKHLTAVAVLNIAFGALGILIAIVVFVAVVGGGLISGDAEAMAITAVVGTVVASFLMILSIPEIIGGFGLLKRRPWARILVLITAFLDLINIPFGTIIGIYTIWVLLKDETAQLFAAKKLETNP
jgi:hypothetical protein